MISGSCGDYPATGGIHISYNPNEALHGALPHFRKARTDFSVVVEILKKQAVFAKSRAFLPISSLKS